MIAKCKNLTYLDDRPVKPIDRIGAEAYMEGGAQAEIKARKEYADEHDFVKKVRKDEKFEQTYEERKAKAINNMRNEYESRKLKLESQKRYLVEEVQKYPNDMEKKMKISWEIHSIDYQMKENEKYYKVEQQDVIGAIVKREKLDINSVFVFEDWMLPIIEKNIVENFFHFERALRLIKNDLKIHDYKNYDLLTEFELRTKWSELELNKFRAKNDKFFIDQTLPINNNTTPIQNDIVDTAKAATSNPEKEKQVKMDQKLEKGEEFINTSSKEVSNRRSDNSIYDDVNNDDIIYLPKHSNQQDSTINTKSNEHKTAPKPVSKGTFDELD